MNLYPHLTDARRSLVDKFYALQTPARRDSIWAKLTGQSTDLAIFPEQPALKSTYRKSLVGKDIPVEQIVGTLHRQGDFDRKFRPLKSAMRDRWIDTYIALGREGWSPILVHQLGEHYYVEDGHQRISVARSLEMPVIHANVWEYVTCLEQPQECPSLEWPGICAANAFVIEQSN